MDPTVHMGQEARSQETGGKHTTAHAPVMPSDEDLMARFGGGDATSFDELLSRYRRPMFAYVRRSVGASAEAEDLFQEIFLRVIRAAPKWQHDASFKTWIYTVARNVLIDAARKRKSHPTPIALVDDASEGGIAIESLQAKTDSAEEALVADETRKAVASALKDLPEPQREAFLLKESGLTFEAIAAMTGVKKNTVKSRLRYALEKLRAVLVARETNSPEEQP